MKLLPLPNPCDGMGLHTPHGGRARTIQSSKLKELLYAKLLPAWFRCSQAQGLFACACVRCCPRWELLYGNREASVQIDMGDLAPAAAPAAAAQEHLVPAAAAAIAAAATAAGTPALPAPPAAEGSAKRKSASATASGPRRSGRARRSKLMKPSYDETSE